MGIALINTNILTDSGVAIGDLQPLLINPIVGTGSINYVPKFTALTTISASSIYDSGTGVGIGTATPNTTLDVNGSVIITGSLKITGDLTGSAAILNTLTSSDDILVNNVRIGVGDIPGDFTNIVVGSGSLLATAAIPAFSGSGNTAIGTFVLQAASLGSSNTGVGFSALQKFTGSYSTAIGAYALYNSTSGRNTAVGQAALQALATGSGNTALGDASMFYTTGGNFNTAIGYVAMSQLNSGNQNTAVGTAALYQTFVSGSGNTAVGFIAGLGLKTGSYNTILGANVTGLPDVLNNNIILSDGQGNIKARYSSSIWVLSDSIRLPNIPNVTQDNVLSYDTTTGELYYQAASSASVATASYVSSSNVDGPYGKNSILSASFAVQALTSSYADNLTVAGTLTAQTIVVQTITSSVDYVTGSTQFGSLLSNTHQFTGSVTITGSLNVAGGITGVLLSTASWANNAVTASNALTASYVVNAISASQAQNAISSSYPLRGTGKAIYSFDTSNTNTTNVIAIGDSAGQGSTNANDSNFLGYYAGYSATNASRSTFIGNSAGYAASNAIRSVFIGDSAGYGASSATLSIFLGWAAGSGASLAEASFFAGSNAGYGATRASASIFIGRNAGDGAVSASNSVLLGLQVGRSYGPSIGPNNIIIGTNITLEQNRRDSINIGGYIFGTGSYSNTTGNPFSGSVNGRLGINRPLPQYSLDVSGSGNYTDGLAVTGSLNAPIITGSLFGTASWAQNALTASFVASASQTQNAISSSYPVNISGSTVYTPISTNNTGFSTVGGIYIGIDTGYNADSATNAVFLGSSAGYNATDANNSNFIGDSAGYSADFANKSNFIGYQAGYNADNGYSANFIGDQAGYGATYAYQSNFVGSRAGENALEAYNSNFIGTRTGLGAYSASFSILLGYRVGERVGTVPNGASQNNIIIGTSVTLDDSRRDSINIGGLIFGTGSYWPTALENDPYSGSANGYIGINQPLPVYNLDVSGSGRYTGGLVVSGSTIIKDYLTVEGFVSGSLIPSGSELYDLGSDSNRFRDIYLAGSTIHLGGVKLEEISGSLQIFPDPGSGLTTTSFSGSFTGSLSGTASYALTASVALNVPSTASYALQSLSSSYALTASYALNAQGSGFPFTGSAVITGSLVVTGSVIATTGFTGSLEGTASWSINAITASYATTSSLSLQNLITASAAGSTVTFTKGDNSTFQVTLTTATAETASYVTSSNVDGPYGKNSILSASYSISSSYATTSSYAVMFNVSQSLTASGLRYPTADNGEESFIQTDGLGTLSLQYVKTMYEEIYNGEATNIVKGTPLYVSGAVGAAAIVYRADASNPARMPVVYVAADTIAPGSTGRGIVLGLIKGVDTTGYPPGTEIYVAVGGGWTSVRPTGSAIVQILGYVTKEGNGGQGVILNPGPANLPNLNSGSVWVGNSTSLPVAVTTSSLSVASAVSASFATIALTSSYANNLTVAGTLTAQTIVVQTITSSVDFVTGSTRFGSLQSNTHQFTGSVSITGSLNVAGAGITGSLFGTSSWANNAISSSYALSTSQAQNSATSSNILGGRANYIPLWSGSSALTSSVIYQTGSNIVIEGSGSLNPPTPAGLSASFDYGSGNYFAAGFSFNYRVYSYKESPVGRIYSPSYATLGADITDDGSFTSFNVLVSWTAVAGASGYRILLYNDYSGYNYDYGADVTTNSYTDDASASPISEPDTSLTATLNSVNINGTVNITGSINLNNGSLFTITNDKNIVIGGNGNNYGINNNVFIGDNAGYQATNAYHSNFLGQNAGYSASSANHSNFLGQNAGYSASSANQSNFLGFSAGYQASNSSNSNFLGYSAGYSASSANNSNFLGYNAGYNAINANNSNFLGNSAGLNATNAYQSNFLGNGAGAGATNANQSNFLGFSAGYQATNANHSNFLGQSAGYLARHSFYSNFLGVSAGSGATSASFSNFIGNQAGNNATVAEYSNFVGNNAGGNATNANTSNFIGSNVGFNAYSASFSNFIGSFAGFGAVSASYSTLIGYRVGYNTAGGALGIKSNNIIIGTNITLENGRQDSINLGGLIFGTGSYSTITGNPFSGSANGRIGINQPLPLHSLDVSGSGRFTETLVIDSTLTDYSTVTSTTVGSNNVFTQTTGSYTSAFFKYTIASSSNARTGEVVAVWNGTNVQYYDNSTVDLGNTAAVTSSVSIVGSAVQFNVQTGTAGWRVKSLATFM